jgi:hypothetical protein
MVLHSHRTRPAGRAGTRPAGGGLGFVLLPEAATPRRRASAGVSHKRRPRPSIGAIPGSLWGVGVTTLPPRPLKRATGPRWRPPQGSNRRRIEAMWMPMATLAAVSLILAAEIAWLIKA